MQSNSRVSDLVNEILACESHSKIFTTKVSVVIHNLSNQLESLPNGTQIEMEDDPGEITIFIGTVSGPSLALYFKENEDGDDTVDYTITGNEIFAETNPHGIPTMQKNLPMDGLRYENYFKKTFDVLRGKVAVKN